MTVLNDKEITDLALNHQMIEPFEPTMIRKVGDRRVFSYGCGSYGYDLRLSPDDFRVFRHIPGTVVDPKDFRPNNVEKAEFHHDEKGDFFVIPGTSYALGVAMERLQVPSDVTVICLGKSSYARCGIIANVTPAEAGWIGHLTLEFSNSSPADVRIYANEGVLQLIFLRGNPCNTSYADRAGKYQDQPEKITFARV